MLIQLLFNANVLHNQCFCMWVITKVAYTNILPCDKANKHKKVMSGWVVTWAWRCVTLLVFLRWPRTCRSSVFWFRVCAGSLAAADSRAAVTAALSPWAPDRPASVHCEPRDTAWSQHISWHTQRQGWIRMCLGWSENEKSHIQCWFMQYMNWCLVINTAHSDWAKMSRRKIYSIWYKSCRILNSVTVITRSQQHRERNFVC